MAIVVKRRPNTHNWHLLCMCNYFYCVYAGLVLRYYSIQNHRIYGFRLLSNSCAYAEAAWLWGFWSARSISRHSRPMHFDNVLLHGYLQQLHGYLQQLHIVVYMIVRPHYTSQSLSSLCCFWCSCWRWKKLVVVRMTAASQRSRTNRFFGSAGGARSSRMVKNSFQIAL